MYIQAMGDLVMELNDAVLHVEVMIANTLW